MPGTDAAIRPGMEEKTQTDYQQLGAQIGQLVAAKQKAYGDAVGKTEAIMQILYPRGVPPERLGDMLLVVRVLDKICRLAAGEKEAFEENPWQDIAGYGLLGMAKEMQ